MFYYIYMCYPSFGYISFDPQSRYRQQLDGIKAQQATQNPLRLKHTLLRCLDFCRQRSGALSITDI